MAISQQDRPAFPHAPTTPEPDIDEQPRPLPPPAPSFRGSLSAAAVFLMTAGGGGVAVLSLTDDLGLPDYLDLSFYCTAAFAVGCALFILHALVFLTRNAEHIQQLAGWQAGRHTGAESSETETGCLSPWETPPVGHGRSPLGPTPGRR